MGRSTNKCFSMLTCAGVGGGGGDVAADPANTISDDTGDCHCEESKALSDKSRWSFRRRSTRHRVLRNNELKDPEPITNKENSNPDPITENNNSNNNNFSSPKYSSATEKSVSEQEKPKENNVIVREIEEKFTENNKNNNNHNQNIKEIDEKIEENNSVIKETEENLNLNSKEDIEEKELGINSDQIKITENNKNENLEPAALVISNLEPAALVIQSGFRGYMARRELVKMKKIVKIQAVVRGFLVRSQMVGTLRCLLAIIKMQSLIRSHQVKVGSKICPSNENILLNGFPSKIMDAMPKTKAIHIKCDPNKPNSTWEWLERWSYSVISSNGPDFLIQTKILEESVDQLDPNREENEISHLDDDILLPPDSDSNSNSKFIPTDFESDVQIQKPDSEDTEEEIPKTDIVQEDSTLKIEIETEKLESNNLSETKLEENEPNKPGMKKLINPAFAAAQMKFQELSSNPNPSPNSNSNSYTFPSPKSPNNNNTTNHENNNKNNSNHSYNITGGLLLKATSECGTEISISSTLDSPDRSETEGGEIVLEIGNLEMKNYQNTPIHSETLKPEPETPNPNSEFEPTENSNSNQMEKEETTVQTPTPTATTITDLNGTPSSQASVNTKKNKTQKDKKHHKKPNVKRSLNTPTITDSQLNAEPRLSNSSLPSYMQATLSARAKACSGSVKMSRDLSNGTESNNNNNNEKKIKRHSLPSGNNNNKELSPRMQRSQSHESEKKEGGTHLHGSSDKRWQI